MATAVQLRIDQGATFKVVVRCLNADSTPFDLSGWVASMKIRRASGGREVIWSSNSNADTGLTIEDADTGEILVTVAAADSSNFNLDYGSVFAFDLEITKAGEVKRILEGSVYVSREATS